VVAYLGEPVALDDLLYRTDGSLVRQAVDSELMTLLNLGGFGMTAWAPESPDSDRPFTYRTPAVPTFDRNLRALSRKVCAGALVAHVRGVVYDERERVGAQNLHPFMFEDATIALAQNGDLYDFGRMRFDLLEHVRPELAGMIEGTTDTEWVYALVLSMLDDPFARVDAEDAVLAVRQALGLLRTLRERRGIAVQSPVNLVLSDGRWLVATRFAFDYGWYPDDDSFFAGEREHDYTTLWYTLGGGYPATAGAWAAGDGATTSLLLASEPLTKNPAGWLEVPEYSLLIASPDADGGVTVELRELTS
jgi:glutamine amidotransferase